MIASKINNDIGAILAPYITTLKDFKAIGNTPFRLNALNGVYAPAKAGKTYFVLEQLNTIGSKYTVVWLDGDRNSELKDKFNSINHYPLDNTTEAFNALIESKKDFSDTIFVVDSFKDFTFGFDTDSNQGSQSVMNMYQKLLDLDATVVIIYHATKTDFGFKIKGNADTILSKTDFMYKLVRDKENFVSLTVECSREEGLNTGDILTFGNSDVIALRIKEYVNNHPKISLRELKRAQGLSSYEPIIDELKGIVYRVIKDPNNSKGRPKKIVELI